MSDDARQMMMISVAHEKEYAEHGEVWFGSPFEWITKLSSRAKGAVGEKLIEDWATGRGFVVGRPESSEHDRKINGKKIEIKLSTLWESGGYKFQQIRDQDYDYCICLALAPHDVKAWILPKGVIKEYVIGHMGQHTGAGGSDTAWIGFQDGAEYEWMKPYGDRLERVAEIIAGF